MGLFGLVAEVLEKVSNWFKGSIFFLIYYISLFFLHIQGCDRTSSRDILLNLSLSNSPKIQMKLAILMDRIFLLRIISLASIDTKFHTE
jgi:hypothetical protein